MNELQISMLIIAIAFVGITAIIAMVTKPDISDIYELEHDLDRLKVRVGGDLMEINSKLRVIEDKFKVMEQMEFIEKVKKICDEESFSYEVFNSIENRYADIKIFSKELDTSFLLEMSKICDYDLRERTENSIIIRVCLKGE